MKKKKNKAKDSPFYNDFFVDISEVNSQNFDFEYSKKDLFAEDSTISVEGESDAPKINKYRHEIASRILAEYNIICVNNLFYIYDEATGYDTV